ncbi:hypothetical protein JN086_06640 [Mycolicibacterium austroafricanum]|uniref:DUF3592 domain-containing protein n=1 Tax=Mycolicibacterium austroafricanum TaxID=39687 RepID=A0ABT8H840_MYCAO|nr:hypothetical protein [Mycolicibacterium austroafricanum]MDN4516925.1 hypothetical protein [Mycolicibacterium austroafricanum]QRZ08026.1 hypothetical protein JN090_05640 [Mycolicibacterium austroafricanum]QZT69689.1 hypothetical protein JN086_06640 [Mycolicibacterium austroafricanum]
MQTNTFGLGVWARRLVARSPIVRGTDRVEAAALLLVAALSILTVPIAGAVGTAEYDRLVHTYAEQRLVKHEVDATAVRDSRGAPQPYEKPYVTEVSWDHAGTTHTAEIRTRQMSAGDRVRIWVDDAGNRTVMVPSDQDAAAEAVVAALALWSVASGTGLAGWLLLRMRLNRMRFQAWDRELDDLADNGGRANNNTP